MTLLEMIAKKDELIAQKKSEKSVYKMGYGFSFVKSPAMKSADSNQDTGILEIEVVANMAWFMDSQDDVLTDTCWAKPCQEKGNNIPFLHDHIHKVEARIGTTLGWETKKIDLPNPYQGMKGSALIHKGLVRKDYNSSVYNQYKNGDIRQHSIGLQYIQIDLATNEPSDEKGYKLWVDNKKNIINFDKAEKLGYFWLVKEIRLLENSAVWMGANELTPTLTVQPYSGKSNTGEERKFFTTIKSLM